MGVGEDISYYYAFNAGPGTVTVIVDGKNKRVSYGANAIGIELSNLDAERLLSIRLGNTSKDDRKVGHVQFGRQQRIIMRVLLDKRTIDYKVRLEGAVGFSPAPSLVQALKHQVSSEHNPNNQGALPRPLSRPRTGTDPRGSLQMRLGGLALGEDISYYYVFNAGPGTVRATVDGKNQGGGGLANAIGIELFDIDAEPLLKDQPGRHHGW